MSLGILKTQISHGLELMIGTSKMSPQAGLDKNNILMGRKKTNKKKQVQETVMLCIRGRAGGIKASSSRIRIRLPVAHQTLQDIQNMCSEVLILKIGGQAGIWQFCSK